MSMTSPAGPADDRSSAELAEAQDLAAQFVTLGYHAVYGGRLGVEIRRDDAAAILAILRGGEAETAGRAALGLTSAEVAAVRAALASSRPADPDLRAGRDSAAAKLELFA